MKTHTIIKCQPALIAVLIGAALLAAVQPVTAMGAKPSKWTNNGTGDWDTAANWDTGIVPTGANYGPGAGQVDTAIIDNGGTAVVSNGIIDESNNSNGVLVAHGGLQVTGTGGVMGVELHIGTSGSGLAGGAANVGSVTVSGSATMDFFTTIVGNNATGYLNLSESGTFGSGLAMFIGASGTEGTGGVIAPADGVGVVTVSDSAVLMAYQLAIGGYGNGSSFADTGILHLNGGTVFTFPRYYPIESPLGLNMDGGVYLGLGENSRGVLVIGGDGSGQLLNGEEGLESNTTPATIFGGEYYTGSVYVVDPIVGGASAVQFAHSGTINFANVITGTNISIEQNGPGSTTLTADSAIKNLSVSGGILNIDQDATLTLQSGSATVSNGGILGGAGTLTGGLLTVESGGVLSTTLTLENGITLEAGAIIDYAGNENGLLVTGGVITVNNGIIVDLSILTETGIYTVLDWNGATAGGGISETSFTAANLDAGITGSFTVANNRLIFTASAIPEPSTYFLLGIGLGALLLAAHRRRRVQS
jgi:hypothetical protein